MESRIQHPEEMQEKPPLNWLTAVLLPEKDVPAPVSVINRGSDEFCHLGDIQAIEGHSGTGKTYILSAILAAALWGAPSDQCLDFECQMAQQDIRVLLVDTEQALGNVQKVQRRMLKMAGRDPKRTDPGMRVISLREYSPVERLEMMRQAVAAYRPTMMAIDNVKDLVNDFNDIEESQRLVGELMKISSGKMTDGSPMAVLCVIHQNFSSDKARGHLGSLIYEKASLVMAVKVDTSETHDDPKPNDNGTVDHTFLDVRKVSYSKVRNEKPADFWFYIDQYGMPRRHEPKNGTSNPKGPKEAQLQSMMEQVLHGPMSYTDLWKALMEATGKAERTSKMYINAAVEKNIIIKNGDYYEINDTGTVPF